MKTTPKTSLRTPAALLMFLATAGTLSAAINIDNFSTSTNDRFANDPSFIAAAYDLSGVALNDSGRWVTMISPNVFISAEHFKPATGSSVTFYAANDPAGMQTTRTVSNTFQQIGSTDLYLGTLTNPLGSAYTYYDYLTLDIPPGNISGTALLFGRSQTSFSVSQDMAVGRNAVAASSQNQTVTNLDGSQNTGDAILTYYEDSTDPEWVIHEADLQSGDSGAPMMGDFGNGRLTIIGINWFVGTDTSGNDINGHTYVGNYDQDIQAFIAANPVPEPQAAAVLLAITTAGFVISRRRRRLP